MSVNKAGHDGPFTRLTDGNAWGYNTFNSAVNTNLNVRHTTQEAFILHTLDAQWASTPIQIVGRKKQSYDIPQQTWCKDAGIFEDAVII